MKPKENNHQDGIEKVTSKLADVKDKAAPAAQTAYGKIMSVGAVITDTEAPEKIGEPTAFAKSRKAQ